VDELMVFKTTLINVQFNMIWQAQLQFIQFRGLYGNGDGGNTAVTRTTFTVIPWGWGAMPTVIPR